MCYLPAISLDFLKLGGMHLLSHLHTWSNVIHFYTITNAARAAYIKNKKFKSNECIQYNVRRVHLHTSCCLTFGDAVKFDFIFANVAISGAIKHRNGQNLDIDVGNDTFDAIDTFTPTSLRAATLCSSIQLEARFDRTNILNKTKLFFLSTPLKVRVVNLTIEKNERGQNKLDNAKAPGPLLLRARVLISVFTTALGLNSFNSFFVFYAYSSYVCVY